MTIAVTDLWLEGRIERVSLELRAGEVTAICGPNGAGKSSLLACLAGALRGEGRLRLDGTDLATLPPRTRAQTIGYLPQQGEVAWDLSVRTLASLGRLPWGDEDAVAIDAALAALDLDELADRPVGQLSGGERARALLARVLAGTPCWILADEPLAALDLAHQIALIGQFRRLAQEGLGVVLVLHDLTLAMNNADRVVVLDRGRIAADGAPAESLSPAVIERVWGVAGRWLGEPGTRALALT